MQRIHCHRNMSQNCETLAYTAKDVLHLLGKLLKVAIRKFCTNYLKSDAPVHGITDEA